MYDLLIRGGTVVDGTGAPSFVGDVAIRGRHIVAVGKDLGPARRELDATGCIVTPGFVDIHTHYDAQVTWDPYLSPSVWHGVTTAVMGNCGVGFAPARPDQHDFLIALMEGVEDIPGAALTEGIRWGWESFPEYMDVLDKMPRALDVAVQVPHGALRTYVMDDRGARNEHATADDISQMAALVHDGIAAGALGFSTSRTLIHKSRDGEYVPGTFAEEAELMGLGRALKVGNGGLFQMTSNHATMESELGWMERLSLETGLPVTFNLVQIDDNPTLWQKLLTWVEGAAARGARVIPQVAGRPAGILMGWHATANPFVGYPTWQKLVGLSPEVRAQKLREPATRAALMAERPVDMGAFANYITHSFHKMFPLGPQVDYEPRAETSIAAIAAREGRDPREVVYDALLEENTHALVYFPLFNYSTGDMSALHTMLSHPMARLSLGDGGAHCGAICDASIPTFMLTHWVRDRSRGPRLALEWAIRRQTRDTAELFGLNDRGTLTPGLLADVNVIDFEHLQLKAPRMVWDLPAGGRRFVQDASGYRFTVKSGQVIREDGTNTGVLPGELLRGRR